MVVDMNYWIKVLKKIIITAVTIFLIYLSFKMAIFYMPFLIAFIISLMLEPGIKLLMKKGKLTRKKSAIIILILITVIIGGIIAFTSSTLISETSGILNNINVYAQLAIEKIQNLNELIIRWNIPESVISTLENSSTELINTISNLLTNTLKTGVSIISSIPTVAIYFVITILSLYFLCTDKVYMVDQMEHHLPESWVRKIYVHTKEITKSLGNYIKAQSILILISFIITLIGLYSFHFIGFNVEYPLIYALGIGFIDALPIFGSGTVMIPWAVISSSIGDIKLGLSLLVLWVIITATRQLLEPKIVGKHIGIHPIFTLIAMYTGFKIMGLIGLFIGPIILIILKNIFSTMIDNGVVKTIFSR